MSKLIMLSGLPASGKSTRAKEIVAQGNWIRVNRDLLRTMLHFDKWSGKNEEMTTLIEMGVARRALLLNKNVVVDDCNLNPKNKEMWGQLAIESEASFEHERIETDWHECVMRDQDRPNAVGSIVIKNMAIQWGLYKFNPDSVVICDIDGTIADCEHRKHHLTGEKKDWKGFFGDMHKDTVRKDVAAKIISLYNQGKCIVYVSARPEGYRDTTIKWLEENSLSFGFTILMRRDGDSRPDTEVKQQILDTFFKDKSVIHKVFDDRPSVIRMWKANGLEVEDVGNGVEF